MGDEVQVVVDGMTYSLVERPASNTAVVLSEREKLLGHIDLRTLVQDLGRVGMCVFVAYNAVTAAGPNFTKLQIEVQDLGYDVTRLCDKSAITVSKFKRACETVLDDLQTTYEYLLDNFEEMALDTLASVSELAGKMAEAADELQEEFNEEALKVREVAVKTKTEQGKQALLVKEKELEREKLKEDQKQQEEEVLKACQLEAEAEQLVRQYEMKEDKAIESIGDEGNVLERLVNGVTSNFGFRLFGKSDEAKAKQRQMWREKKLESLENRQRQSEMRKKAYNELNDFAVRIKRCSGEENMAEAAYDALHQAESSLKMLSKLMMQAALFWKQMQEHCKALGDDKMKQTVEQAMKFDDSRRLKLWTSRGFKIKAVRFFGGWVALNDVCSEYMLAIQETQTALYKYITKNPTYEKAKANLKTLAEDFEKDVGEAQKAIEEQESKTEEEIRSLKEEESPKTEEEIPSLKEEK